MVVVAAAVVVAADAVVAGDVVRGEGVVGWGPAGAEADHRLEDSVGGAQAVAVVVAGVPGVVHPPTCSITTHHLRTTITMEAPRPRSINRTTTRATGSKALHTRTGRVAAMSAAARMGTVALARTEAMTMGTVEVSITSTRSEWA